MKQPGLDRLRESLLSNDPLDIVNAFIKIPLDYEGDMLPDYWEHRICALAELIVEMRKEATTRGAIFPPSPLSHWVRWAEKAKERAATTDTNSATMEG